MAHDQAIKNKDRKGKGVFPPVIKQCVGRVGILDMIRYLHLTFSKNHAQMELTRFLNTRFRGSKLITFCFHHFSGKKVYCSYIGAQEKINYYAYNI